MRGEKENIQDKGRKNTRKEKEFYLLRIQTHDHVKSLNSSAYQKMPPMGYLLRIN